MIIFVSIQAGFKIGMSDGGLVTEAKPSIQWDKVEMDDDDMMMIVVTQHIPTMVGKCQ